MINQHLRDRFFQRYGEELTSPVLQALVVLAMCANPEPDPAARAGRERVTIYWSGKQVRVVWNRAKRVFITFLPPRGGARIAASLPKRRRRRR